MKESGISQIHMDEAIHERALERFSLDEGLSLTDAATVEMISRFRIGSLATYDERSFTKYAKELVGSGSWQRLTADEKREAEEIDRAK